MIRFSRTRVLAAAAIVLAIGAAYFGTLRHPFVFDDRAAIVENSSIRRLWPISVPLSPPAGGSTVSGRPLVNLSFAVNYALGGTNPIGYRIGNLVIHAVAALALFGVVRRGAMRAGLTPEGSWKPALFAAVIWAVHPLSTAAVSSAVQRAELLAAWSYLMTLYCFLRACHGPGDAARGAPGGWLAASVVACGLGIASKEIVVTAPFAVLLLDRALSGRRVGAVLIQRWPYYACLAANWIVAAALLAASRSRGGTVGFSTGVDAGAYLLTQAEALGRYFRAVVWPHPLVFDYGEYLTRNIGSVVAPGGIALLLAGVAGWAAFCARSPQRRLAGTAGVIVFLVLAPTSTFVPIASQTIAEHRMYLPLGIIVALASVTGANLVRSVVFAAAAAVLAAAMGAITVTRNHDYRSETALWSATAIAWPENIRAQLNLAAAWMEAGRVDEAVTMYERVQSVRPTAEVHANLCQAYVRLNRVTDAVRHGEAAVALQPSNSDARVNLAAALIAADRLGDAVTQYREALRLQPDAADIAGTLGRVLTAWAAQLAKRGQFTEARQHVSEAIRLAPRDAEARFVGGNVAAAAQDFGAAIGAYEQVLELAPDHLGARNNLANCQLATGRFADAIGNYEQVLRARPGDRSVQQNLAVARGALNRSKK